MPTKVENGIITFPMFGDGFAITASDHITLFGRDIYWYGIIIACGFILAFIYVNNYRKRTGLGSDDYFDYLIWAIISAIIGARLYYVIFNFSLYKDNLLSILKIWEGGLAIYGGIIGAVIAIVIVSARKKIPAAMVLDTAAPGLLIGQAVGRFGNLMNREAFGAETEIFCRMGLTDAAGNTLYVHPTFLYESLWNLLGLLIIHIYTKKKGRRYDGQVFAFYIAWYGFIRMLIEGLRTDSLYLFGTSVRVSQLLAALSFLAATFILCYNGSVKHSPEKLYVNAIKAQEEEAEITPYSFESEEDKENDEENQ